MEETLQQVLTELRELRHEFQILKKSTLSSRKMIESMLRRRGVHEVKYTSGEHTLLPPDCSKSAEDELYRLMKKYSFRIFLRDLIRHLDHLSPKHLTKYCSENIAQEYLEILVNHHMLRQLAAWQYQFTSRNVTDFGDTLEWFVAEVMKREFDSPATWGNRLKNNYAGGDYDVICAVEGRLIYIEVKSSPPKHIDISEVTAFMNRVQSLRPDVAIFLEDTHLRMKDKLAVMFEEEMWRRYGKQAEQEYPVRRFHDEIFTINNILFISNTKPDLITNLEVCLKQILAAGF